MTDQESSIPVASRSTLDKKTVSFGDVAMAYNANNDLQEGSTNISAADIQQLQFQKNRAKELLTEML